MNRKATVVTLERFDKSLKQLAKRYKGITDELAKLVILLENHEISGDRIPHIRYEVYKVRVANPAAQKGKSGGFRVIYYLKNRDFILLIDIYSKSDLADIPPSLIAKWIEEYEQN